MICATPCALATPFVPKPVALNVTEAGSGKPLLLLHGSAGSAALWRAQVAAFSRHFHVIAPDLIGYGASPPWPAGRPFDLEDEVRCVESLMCGRELPFHLVGYSYGGAVALALALANPAAVASLTLIEPVAFSALRFAGEAEALAEASRQRADCGAAMANRGREEALRLFLDYWTGPGSWGRLPREAREGMFASAEQILLNWEATFHAELDMTALGKLDMPTLLLHGGRSPLSTRRIAAVLAGLLPRARLVELAAANHMLPVTHGAELTDLLRAHFAAADAPEAAWA